MKALNNVKRLPKTNAKGLAMQYSISATSQTAYH